MYAGLVAMILQFIMVQEIHILLQRYTIAVANSKINLIFTFSKNRNLRVFTKYNIPSDTQTH